MEKALFYVSKPRCSKGSAGISYSGSHELHKKLDAYLIGKYDLNSSLGSRTMYRLGMLSNNDD